MPGRFGGSARMCRIDGGAKPLDADVGVNLGGGETFMSEKLLDRFQIGAIVE